MDVFIDLIKEKVDTSSTHQRKVQLLTLVPTLWSRKKVMEEFHVSEYTARQARELFRDKGLLAAPELRKGKAISTKTLELVRTFYESDEYSRMMPGKKDSVSISKNVHVQKRLLLANLKELYSALNLTSLGLKLVFQNSATYVQNGVLVGSPGTHSVCVCTIHQNVNLLLLACNIEETSQDLIGYLVCSTYNRDCMLRHCSQ